MINKFLAAALFCAAVVSPLFAQQDKSEGEIFAEFKRAQSTAPTQQYMNYFMNQTTKSRNVPPSVRGIKNHVDKMGEALDFMLAKSKPSNKNEEKTITELRGKLSKINQKVTEVNGVSTVQMAYYKKYAGELQEVYNSLKNSGIEHENKDIPEYNVDETPAQPRPEDDGKPLTYEEKVDRANRTLEAVNNTVIVADNIINTAAKTYELIKENAAVIKSDNVIYSNAMPKGINDWREMAGWSFPPSAVTYTMSLRNTLNLNKFAEITFKVMFIYGGNYQGKGKYLTGVTVQPTKIAIDKGYILDVSCDVPEKSVMNIGDKENPVAGLTLKISWKINKKDAIENTAIFAIDGNGNFYEIEVDENIKKVSEQLIPPAKPTKGASSKNIETEFDKVK